MSGEANAKSYAPLLAALETLFTKSGELRDHKAESNAQQKHGHTNVVEPFMFSHKFLLLNPTTSFSNPLRDAFLQSLHQLFEREARCAGARNKFADQLPQHPFELVLGILDLPICDKRTRPLLRVQQSANLHLPVSTGNCVGIDLQIDRCRRTVGSYLYGSFPEAAPSYPVLWASAGGRHAPFGDVIPMPSA
jgi:hypothetical protein